MPKGPRGEKRPGDVVGAAIMVAKIATGEVEDECEQLSPAAEKGREGGRARAKNMTADERSAVARRAAKARWKIS